MAPPRVTPDFVIGEVDAFLSDAQRAIELYERIALHGHTRITGGIATKLNVPDRRDAAQFIFFEVAAKFEDFAKTMFRVEVRSRLKVTNAQAEFVMGDLDTGLGTKQGWGSPTHLMSRGRNLFGATSFFGSLESNIGSAIYTTLVDAHKVRNRIAHSGGTAQKQYVNFLNGLGLTAQERQGLSVGRLLTDYPTSATAKKRYFFKFLAAYEAFATSAKAKLP